MFSGFVNGFAKSRVFSFVNVMRAREVNPKGFIFPLFLRSPHNGPMLESLE
jgi:hypothetical protein